MCKSEDKEVITYILFKDICKGLGVAVPSEQWYKDNIENNYGG